MSQKRLVIKDELKRLCDELTYNPPAVFETALYVSSAGCTSVYLVNVACHSGPNMELLGLWNHGSNNYNLSCASACLRAVFLSRSCVCGCVKLVA